MAFLSEEVLIKILVGADKALKTLKDVDKNVEKIGKTSTTSAKSIATMGAAFGGAAVGINLLVKGISAQVKKMKEDQAAYVTFARASGEAIGQEIIAIDKLADATARLQLLRGESIAKATAGWKVWVANRKEANADMIEFGDLWDELYNKFLIDETFPYVETFERLVEKIKAARIANEAYNASQLEAAKIQAENDAKAAQSAQELADARRQAALEAAEIARFQSIQQVERINAETEAERNRINESNAFYMALQETQIAAHDAEMARIQAEKEARMEAAQVALESASSMFGTIGDLVSQRYQHEIDAAEGNEEKQNELRKKQFNSEKAFAIVQSLIATALGITKAIPNIPLMIFSAAQGAVQTALIAGQRAPSFATGTPPGGYVVPPGYEDDSFPVRAKSGETVTVTNGSQSGGQTIIIELDGRQLGRAVTGLFENRYARVPAAVVA